MFRTIKAQLLKLMNFLRITDENGLFSFTNGMMWIFLYKMKDIQLTSVDTNAVLLALIPTGAYTAKKVIDKVKAKVITEVKELPSEIMDKLKDGNN